MKLKHCLCRHRRRPPETIKNLLLAFALLKWIFLSQHSFCHALITVRLGEYKKKEIPLLKFNLKSEQF